MNALQNSVQLVGNLGQDVDYKELSNNNALARVSMATHEVYSKDGEKVKETQWHNIVGWGQLAEKMNVFFKKGKRVMIKGKLVHRSYEDKNGQKRNISEVVAKEFMLID